MTGPTDEQSKLKPCPFCGATVNSEPSGGIYVNHPIDREYPFKCNMVNATITVSRWTSRPGEQAARVEVLELVKLTLNTIIRAHRDNPLSFNKMANKEREVVFALDQICKNYQLKFGELIEAEK